MRRYKMASQILLIYSFFNLVPAAPVAVRDMKEARVSAVDAAEVGMAVSERWMDPGDQSSTNAGYLTDESQTISSDSTSSPSELDSATSPLWSIGQPPWPADDSPPHLGPVQVANPSPWYSVSTADLPPQTLESQPEPDRSPASTPEPSTDNSPPPNPQPAPDNSHPPPSNPGPSTGSHSPLSMKPQDSGAHEAEDFLSMHIKGKIKRHISSYGPENVVQREFARHLWP